MPAQHPERSDDVIADIVGVAPETISVWKCHPQWQQELARCRQVAETFGTLAEAARRLAQALDRAFAFQRANGHPTMVRALRGARILVGPSFAVRT
jgi:hypothetical protein